MVWDHSHPLNLSTAAGTALRRSFRLLGAAPILSTGWALLGELGKVVPVSPQRFVAPGDGEAPRDTDLLLERRRIEVHRPRQPRRGRDGHTRGALAGSTAGCCCRCCWRRQHRGAHGAVWSLAILRTGVMSSQLVQCFGNGAPRTDGYGPIAQGSSTPKVHERSVRRAPRGRRWLYLQRACDR